MKKGLLSHCVLRPARATGSIVTVFALLAARVVFRFALTIYVQK
jgi:hypothetical protein